MVCIALAELSPNAAFPIRIQDLSIIHLSQSSLCQAHMIILSSQYSSSLAHHSRLPTVTIKANV